MSVVRVSILRCTAKTFAPARDKMAETAGRLVPGLKVLPGCLAYFAGEDAATLSLTNVSIWETLEAAQQMDRFQPMLDLAREFAAMGVTFERPIMNYETLWQIGTAGR